MNQLHPQNNGRPEHSSKGDETFRHPQQNHRSKRNAGRKMNSILTICFIALGIFCVIRLCGTHSQNQALEKQQLENLSVFTSSVSAAPTLSQDVAPSAAMPSPSASPSAAPIAASVGSFRPLATQIPANYRPEMLPQFDQLYQNNNDLIGWIKINSLYRINFAIVQGSNNFYMNHGFDKAENVNGTAFLDETCKIWPRDDNLIIYAHNMKSGEMFGELNQLQYRDKLYPDPFVFFDTLYEQGTYVPLAVFVCSVVQADDFFQFHVRNFKTEDAFEKYIDRARELSLISLKTDARYGDDLLTLVTCYDQANTQRFVVLLRKLRESETAESVKADFFK